MAIHQSFPGIEVTVQVDSVNLVEYDAENDQVNHPDPDVSRYKEARTVTKYVESQTGKTYTVKINVRKPYNMDCPGLVFRWRTDSQTITGIHLTREGYELSMFDYSHVLEGQRADKGNMRDTLKFSEINSSKFQFNLQLLTLQCFNF